MRQGSFGEYIRQLRESADMPLRKLAAIMDIDQSTLSKLERGERPVNRQMLPIIATTFNLEEKDLVVRFISNNIVVQLANEIYREEILSAAENELRKLEDLQKG
jgi:transcriptional regulator with XRE-family HTH domain